MERGGGDNRYKYNLSCGETFVPHVERMSAYVGGARSEHDVWYVLSCVAGQPHTMDEALSQGPCYFNALFILS